MHCCASTGTHRLHWRPASRTRGDQDDDGQVATEKTAEGDDKAKWQPRRVDGGQVVMTKWWRPTTEKSDGEVATSKVTTEMMAAPKEATTEGG